MAAILTNFINKIQIDNSVKNSINPEIINWGDIIVWFAILGLILAIIVFFLSNKKSERILNFISNNLLPISLIVWLLGIFIYIIGFYRPDINCFPVILRSIMSAFKMFLVIQDLARIQADLLNDTLYMSTFSLIHFIAAFITFLFVFKMIGYKIKSSLNIIIHKLFYAKEKNIKINFIKIDSLEKAKNAPCIFNNWANFYKGEFISNTILNANSFEKLIK